MPVAIEVNGVSKRFSLDTERVSSLKERAVRGKRKRSTPFWALSDVSLDIEEGETVGLLGHNGSGKSTLLKLVGGIMKPTKGSIRVRGRLASLLELGAGFHPELTGRENVYINGALLGLSRRDLEARFDDIVEFAELEQFIDMQVRNYSSGMFIRLGFAVAVNVDPDVLLVDEVLAVGDENFQRKCLDRMHQFQREDRTIVVVSHSADQLRSICDRVAVLDHGRLVAFGPPGEAIRVFREHMLDTQLQRRAAAEAKTREAEAAAAEAAGPPVANNGEGPASAQSPPPTPMPSTAAEHGYQQAAKRNLKVRIVDVDIDHQHRATRRYLLPGEPLSVRVRFLASEPVDDAVFGLAVVDNRDGRNLFGINTRILDLPVPPLLGPGEIHFDIASVPLLDGTYPVTIGIHARDEGTVYDWSEQQHFFEVMNPDRRAGTVAMPVEISFLPGPARAASPPDPPNEVSGLGPTPRSHVAR